MPRYCHGDGNVQLLGLTQLHLRTDMFGIFGRSQELQSLDRAFRTAGINPRGVAEAVKLTTLKQLKEASPGRAPDLRAYAAAAELIAYCALGREAFTESNDADQTESVEARLIDAMEMGHGLNARLVLLTLHAGLIHASVVERYKLTAE